MQVYGDELLAEASLKRLRLFYPHERIILCSDGGNSEAVFVLGKQFNAEAYAGERLYSIEHGGALWQRALDFFLISPTAFFVKIDPDTRIDRPFTCLPSRTAISGHRHLGGFVQGGCIIIPLEIAKRLLDSQLLTSQKSHDFAVKRLATKPDWTRMLGKPCINTDWMLHWACKTLGIETCQHSEVYSDWMVTHDNDHQVYAVIHPDKFLHHPAVFRSIFLQNHLAIHSLINSAVHKEIKSLELSSLVLTGSLFVGFRGNAGDELMLRAISQRFPHARLEYHRKSIIGDVLLDASGYYFGAPWGKERLRMMGTMVPIWKRQGKQIILLPQSFGPFVTDQDRIDMQNIVQNADCIFAREPQSYQHLKALVSSDTRLRIAPDFTLHVPAIFSREYDHLRGSVAIVPNMRMLDQTCIVEAQAYSSFILRVMHVFAERGFMLFLLAHERKDLDLCQEIQRKYGQDIPVIVEQDAQVIKGIVGSCYAVVGSRYHALVSALSQGVPAIGAGWHDKYDALYRLYNCQNLLLHVTDSQEDIENVVFLVCDEKLRLMLCERLRHCRHLHHCAVEAMWSEVETILSLHSSKRGSLLRRLQRMFS